jgi:hypothetical protein
MVRSITLALAFASASAFAPSPSHPKSTAIHVKPVNKEIGVLPPLGFFE